MLLIIPGRESLDVGLGRQLGILGHDYLVERFGVGFRVAAIDTRRFELSRDSQSIDRVRHVSSSKKSTSDP